MVFSRTIWVLPETSEVACAQTRFLVPPPTARMARGSWPASR